MGSLSTRKGSTTFLDKTRRETGPEAPLPSLWYSHVHPKL